MLNRRNFLATTVGAAATTPLLSCSLVGQSPTANLTPQTGVALSRTGVAATVHPLATQSAIASLESGGNAIDAAIAASIMLSVVDGHNSGIGGGCLATVRTAGGEIFCIDGRETAPALATPDQFYTDGKPDPRRTQFGPRAVGVPGLIATLERLGTRLGNQEWTASFDRAIDVADAGFKIDRNYAATLAGAASQLQRFPSSVAVLFGDDRKPLREGDRLVQSDLAKVLTSIQKDGSDWFYRGEFAKTIDEYMQKSDGLIRLSDMEAYRTKERVPIQTSYRGQSVIGFPPPSSGGLHVAQMLRMLNRFDVASIFQQDTATGLHLLLEVMKLAMSDRTKWLGDSDYTDVPAGLLDEDYVVMRSEQIDLERSSIVNAAGQPTNMQPIGGKSREKHTTHLTTADAQGNVVAITQTVNTSFGSKIVLPGTGVVLNNQMDDFSIAPGVANAFGLIGSAANSIQPGKRPLSSMSPTIVLDADANPIFSCGAAGGPKILTTVLQLIVGRLDLNMSLDECVRAPRVHHQWQPDRAVVESSLSDEVIDKLAAKGHTIEKTPRASVAQAIAIDNQLLSAMADPRVPSSAMGVE